MSFRAIAGLGLLLAAYGAERFAHYGGRSVLGLEMYRNAGMTAASIGTAFLVMSIVTLLAAFAGAGLALGIGPRLTAVVGALVATLGHVLLALDGPILLGWGIACAGAGIFRVCPFVAAVEVLATEAGPAPQTRTPHPQRFIAVTAFAATAFVAINAGSFLAAPIAGALYSRGGRGLLTGFTGGVAFVAALLAGVAALVGILGRADRAHAPPPRDPYRAAAPPVSVRATAPTSMRPLAGAALLTLLIGMFDAGNAMAVFSPSSGLSSKEYGSLLALSSAVALIVCLIAAGAFLVAALVRSSMPPLPVFGAGLAIAGAGFFLRAFGGEHLPVLAVGAVMTSLGDVMLPIGTAYVALAVPSRASGLALAGWFAVAMVASLIGSPLGDTPLRTPLLILTALVCLGAGAGIAVLGRTLHRTWFDPPAS